MKTFIPPENSEEIDRLITEIRIPLSANATQDRRICIFCNGIGDMINNGPGRYVIHHDNSKNMFGLFFVSDY